jgi:hypothetical protein
MYYHAGDEHTPWHSGQQRWTQMNTGRHLSHMVDREAMYKLMGGTCTTCMSWQCPALCREAIPHMRVNFSAAAHHHTPGFTHSFTPPDRVGIPAICPSYYPGGSQLGTQYMVGFGHQTPIPHMMIWTRARQ